MKRFLCYFLIEIILLGIVCYFLVQWNRPISNEWIDTTYNTIGFILLIFPIINTIIAYISFSRFTNKYPRNNSSEYCFNPRSSQLGYQGNGNYVIDIKEIEKGIWIAADEQENLKFDMRVIFFLNYIFVPTSSGISTIPSLTKTSILLLNYSNLWN